MPIYSWQKNGITYILSAQGAEPVVQVTLPNSTQSILYSNNYTLNQEQILLDSPGTFIVPVNNSESQSGYQYYQINGLNTTVYSDNSYAKQIYVRNNGGSLTITAGSSVVTFTSSKSKDTSSSYGIVYSNSSSSYPTNGASGDYWYTSSTTYNDITSITTNQQGYIQGSNITINWSPVGGATYILERKIDNNDWEQIYTGSSTSYQDTAPQCNTLQYQVVQTIGGLQGTPKQSSVITIYNTSSSPMLQLVGDCLFLQPITLQWNQPASYIDYYQLQINTGTSNSWTTVYQGANLTYDDLANFVNATYRIRGRITKASYYTDYSYLQVKVENAVNIEIYYKTENQNEYKICLPTVTSNNVLNLSSYSSYTSTGTYLGNGLSGSENPTIINSDNQIKGAIITSAETGQYLILTSLSDSVYLNSSDKNVIGQQITTNSIQYYSNNSISQFNQLGIQYQYILF